MLIFYDFSPPSVPIILFRYLIELRDIEHVVMQCEIYEETAVISFILREEFRE